MPAGSQFGSPFGSLLFPFFPLSNDDALTLIFSLPARPCRISAISSSLPIPLPSPQPPPLLPDPSCSSSSSCPENLDGDALDYWLSRRLRFPVSARGTCSVLKRERKGSKKASGGELLSEHVRVWTEKKVASEEPETECVLPFLTHAPKLVPRLRSTCSVLKRERKGSKKANGGELLSEHVRVLTEKKVASGGPETECILPFLAHAP